MGEWNRYLLLTILNFVCNTSFVQEINMFEASPRKAKKAEKAENSEVHTECPGRSVPFYIVRYYIKMGHYFLDI